MNLLKIIWEWDNDPDSDFLVVFDIFLGVICIYLLYKMFKPDGNKNKA